MTRLELAQQGTISEELQQLAAVEGMSAERLRQGLVQGQIVIPVSRVSGRRQPCAIGAGLRTKVNANIGTSPYCTSLEMELRKLEVALEAKADCIMDLSTGGDLDVARRTLSDQCPVPLGTVPIYQVMVDLAGKEPGGDLGDRLLEVIGKHCEGGVDFITVHCGVTRQAVERIPEERIVGIVSRGGSFTARWMAATGQENPLYERFDELCEIAKGFDVTLSLGDGLRSGCLHDANDRAMVQEMVTLGHLARRARAMGVQVMIEGPGHMPMQSITANVALEKALCDRAPYYVLGPLVTDIAPGFDHITAAIGGAMAAAAGADFLCYVTPSEHLRLPGPEDVRMGVISSRIAAHAGDIAKGLPGAMEWDNQLSAARKKLNWQEMLDLSIYPEYARQVRAESGVVDKDICSMCGDFCAMK